MQRSSNSEIHVCMHACMQAPLEWPSSVFKGSPARDVMTEQQWMDLFAMQRRRRRCLGQKGIPAKPSGAGRGWEREPAAVATAGCVVAAYALQVWLEHRFLLVRSLQSKSAGTKPAAALPWTAEEPMQNHVTTVVALTGHISKQGARVSLGLCTN